VTPVAPLSAPVTVAVNTCAPPVGTLAVTGETVTTMSDGVVVGALVVPQADSTSAPTQRIARQSRCARRACEFFGLLQSCMHVSQGKRCATVGQRYDSAFGYASRRRRFNERMIPGQLARGQNQDCWQEYGGGDVVISTWSLLLFHIGTHVPRIGMRGSSFGTAIYALARTARNAASRVSKRKE